MKTLKSLTLSIALLLSAPMFAAGEGKMRRALNSTTNALAKAGRAVKDRTVAAYKRVADKANEGIASTLLFAEERPNTAKAVLATAATAVVLPVVYKGYKYFVNKKAAQETAAKSAQAKVQAAVVKAHETKKANLLAALNSNKTVEGFAAVKTAFDALNADSKATLQKAFDSYASTVNLVNSAPTPKVKRKHQATFNTAHTAFVTAVNALEITAVVAEETTTAKVSKVAQLKDKAATFGNKAKTVAKNFAHRVKDASITSYAKAKEAAKKLATYKKTLIAAATAAALGLYDVVSNKLFPNNWVTPRNGLNKGYAKAKSFVVKPEQDLVGQVVNNDDWYLNGVADLFNQPEAPAVEDEEYFLANEEAFDVHNWR